MYQHHSLCAKSINGLKPLKERAKPRPTTRVIFQKPTSNVANVVIKPQQRQKLKKKVVPPVKKTRTYSKRTKGPYKKRNGKRIYECTWEGCSKFYLHSYTLDGHMNKHKGIKPYRCFVTDCGKTFFCRTSLIKHRKVHQ